MQEILPGLWHWTAQHPNIGRPVSSYVVSGAGLVLDPLLGDGGPDRLAGMGVTTIALTCRHHRRSVPELQAALGARVLVPEPGLHEFEGDDEVTAEGYASGDELAPGVRAHVLGAIAPDDFVLHVEAGEGALAFADGLHTMDGRLDLMPDELMDDPETVRSRTRERVTELLELPFDALLLAHGDPIPTGGRDALEDWLRRTSS